MRFLLGFALLLTFAPSAEASALYLVTIDTSSLTGTAGSLDFNFAPGLFTTQDASLQILNFSTDGTINGPAQTIGDVTGSLPGPLTFDNQTIYNDYFEGFTYGTEIKFDVDLYGPALDSPDGTSASGSTFAFSMFSDPAGTIPVLTADTIFGVAFNVNVNLDGSTTVASNSMESGIAAAPEPGTLIALPCGALLYAWARARRGRDSSAYETRYRA
jgi:hypothetical protein